MMTVQRILDRKGHLVNTISPGATVLEAAHRMNDLRIGSLVVIDDAAIHGIVTERDILRRVIACECDPAKKKVSEIMTTDMVTCEPGTSLDECRRVMTEQRIRHLPVVESGKLFGIVTIGDLLAQQIADHESTIEYLNAYMETAVAPPGA